MANIYLHWFDAVFCRADGPGNWAKAKLVRYCDDFVVLARYLSKDLEQFIEEKIEVWLGLKINREKTRIMDLRKRAEKLEFLGYEERKDPIRDAPLDPTLSCPIDQANGSASVRASAVR